MPTVYEKLQSCVGIVNTLDKNAAMMSALRLDNIAIRHDVYSMYCEARRSVLDICDSANLDATILPDNMLMLTGQVYVASGGFYVFWQDTLDLGLDLFSQQLQPQYSGRLYNAHKEEIDSLLRSAGEEVKLFLGREYQDR